MFVNIPNRIKELMKKNNIASVNELGRIANIPQSTLATIMLGKTSPRTDTVKQICDGLGISLVDFFTCESDTISANRDDNEIDNLPDHIKKEIDMAKEFVLYKHGIKKPATDK